jgi:hypothetical protein
VVKLLNLKLIYAEGARAKFEDLCSHLIRSQFSDVRDIRTAQGDGGIDIYVGDWADPNGIDVFQAKFFDSGLAASCPQACPAFLKLPINSFFLVSTLMMGHPAA